MNSFLQGSEECDSLPYELPHTPHNCVRGKTRRWRFPLAFRNNQLYSFEPLLPLRIIAIAHADRTVIILREQLLGAFLARFGM